MHEPHLKVELAVQCHNFQRRLCWMLSSILQQDGELPDITVGIAYVKGNGNPTNEAVIAFFRAQGIKIKEYIYDDTSVFQYRGLTRNRQLDETQADWLFYADSDMVYPRDFFATLKRILLSDTYKDDARVLHGERGSPWLKKATKLIDNTRVWQYPCIIPDAYNLVYRLDWQRMMNLGAGYCQIVKVDLLRKNWGYYSKPGRCRDWSWDTRYQKARSDIFFRRRMGREPIPLPMQLHLQHVRDSDDKENPHHIEMQR